MQHPRTARPASVLLGMVYLCFSLACVPDIIAAANIYDKYGGSFFLFLSLFFGAMALYAEPEAIATRAVVLAAGAPRTRRLCHFLRAGPRHSSSSLNSPRGSKMASTRPDVLGDHYDDRLCARSNCHSH